ncbi:MAG: TIGR04086 family membrane protein [Lachnospiraceae bacterium]|nr:TIGR04086 family membrane protein [Lachnospiraceae bacterium]
MAKIREKTNKNQKSNEKNLLHSMIMGLALAYALTSIVFIAYGIILTYTWANEQHISTVALLTTLVSAGFAGYEAAGGANERGLLWGLAEGGLYAGVLFIIGFFATNAFSFDMGEIITLAVSLSAGGIGGIMGINAKK